MADNVSVELFADDARIYTMRPIDSVNFSRLQHGLDQDASWAVHGQLKLSPTKCSVMQLNPKQTASAAPTYTVGGTLYQLPRSARI